MTFRELMRRAYEDLLSSCVECFEEVLAMYLYVGRRTRGKISASKRCNYGGYSCEVSVDGCGLTVVKHASVRTAARREWSRCQSKHAKSKACRTGCLNSRPSTLRGTEKFIWVVQGILLSPR